MDIVQVISAAAGVICGVGGASVIVWKVMLPHIKATVTAEMEKITEAVAGNAQKIRDITARIDDLDRKKRQDYEAIKKQQSSTQSILAALFVILELVEDTPAHAERAGKAKAALQKHLISGI